VQSGAPPGSGTHFRRAAVAAAAVALAIAHALPPDHAAAAGSITGRVKITARARGAALSTNAYSPRAVSVQQTAPTNEIRGVVVYLKDAAFSGPLPTTRREIRQDHESFVPRVIAITRGSTVDFPNGDAFFHNVFSLSGAGTFDLGRYPEGQSRSRQFTKAGLVKVYCHIHSHMSASILVLEHPYFTSPDDSGSFVLPQVPAGAYTLVAWHERVGERLARVSVQPGQASTVEVTLPVADSP
jgi:plastocyanin